MSKRGIRLPLRVSFVVVTVALVTLGVSVASASASSTVVADFLTEHDSVARLHTSLDTQGPENDRAVTGAAEVPVVVLFRDGVDREMKKAILASIGGETWHEYRLINAVAALVPIERIVSLQGNPTVVSVDRDLPFRILDSGADSQIKADQVWPLGFDGTGVRLAILDTGIATAHPEFSGRILLCHSEVSTEPTCEDGNGHGTHVAGIAGAHGVNGAAKGVAPGVGLLIDKVADKDARGNLSTLVAGIEWAVQNQARIISMSVGWGPNVFSGTNCDSYYPSLTAAVEESVSAGIPVIAATGNYGGVGPNNAFAPACISAAIAVGAVDSSDVKADFSSYGIFLRDHGLVAPGVNIFSTWLGGGYATLMGTSMATPMVSGTVALMLSKSPSLTPQSVRNVLFQTADCVELPCPNIDIGYGRVNALSAINALVGSLGGTVFDRANGNAIASASVVASNSARSYSATSDGLGSYAISNMIPDTYTVIVTGPCKYAIDSRSESLQPGTNSLDIGLTAYRGNLNGYVTEGGNPIPQATVRDTCSGITTKTDSSGYYSFDVTAGRSTLFTATATGYTGDFAYLEVPPGGSASHDFWLTVKPPCKPPCQGPAQDTESGPIREPAMDGGGREALGIAIVTPTRSPLVGLFIRRY